MTEIRVPAGQTDHAKAGLAEANASVGAATVSSTGPGADDDR
jgi:hypothetical protein